MIAPQTRMPVVFFGHGNPMNALSKNTYTDAWHSLGQTFPRPKAILAVSAHWYTHNTAVTAMAEPKTIHDFGGFPQELFAFQYPVRGSEQLALRIRELLAPLEVDLDQEWGIDLGSWSVLAHVYPEADIPVVQLSIDATKPADYHYELAKRLAPLRDEGILVIGSGNAIHNLGLMDWNPDAKPFDWASRFDTLLSSHLKNKEHGLIIAYESLSEDARLAIPSPDHFLPMIYCLGLQDKHEPLRITVDGIAHGSIGMMSFSIG